MNKRKFIVRGIIIFFVLVLYPVFYLGGCMHGMMKAVSMSGFISVTDGLVATGFSENGSAVRVFLIGANNESPDTVVVDFKSNDTGRQVGSTTVHAETNANGARYFAFDLPNQFTDSSDKKVSATIHRP